MCFSYRKTALQIRERRIFEHLANVAPLDHAAMHMGRPYSHLHRVHHQRPTGTSMMNKGIARPFELSPNDRTLDHREGTSFDARGCGGGLPDRVSLRFFCSRTDRRFDKWHDQKSKERSSDRLPYERT